MTQEPMPPVPPLQFPVSQLGRVRTEATLCLFPPTPDAVPVMYLATAEGEVRPAYLPPSLGLAAWYQYAPVRVMQGASVEEPREPREVDVLGPNERDAQWIDNEGERWCWHPLRNMWQYQHGISTWYDVPGTDGDQTTSAAHGPYREVAE